MNKSRLLLAVLLLVGYGSLNAMGKLAGAAANLRAAQKEAALAVAKSTDFLRNPSGVICNPSRVIRESKECDRRLQRDQERHEKYERFLRDSEQDIKELQKRQQVLMDLIAQRPAPADIETQTDVIPVPVPVHVVQSAAEIEPVMGRRKRREQSESDLSAQSSAAAPTVDVQHVELQQPESAPAVQVSPVQQETQPVRSTHWWSSAQSLANSCFTYIKTTRTVTKIAVACCVVAAVVLAVQKALEHKSSPK